jgi:succinyl-CoA synthetase beta subunit
MYVEPLETKSAHGKSQVREKARQKQGGLEFCELAITHHAQKATDDIRQSR